MKTIQRLLTLITVMLLVNFSGLVQTAEPAKNRMTASTFTGLKLRSIGPALMSGRISDIALDPTEPNTWYVAAGSGNLWKTTNAGISWSPIFEQYGSYSIGCVTIDPNDSQTIWVGTGEAVSGRHVGFGDGVYLSQNGGKTFKNLGLKSSDHIAKILVDPRDSTVVYVASQGPLWSSGGQRGLYKSTNQGKTWKNILSKGKYTGVTDIAFDPRNPDVIYAATHQRHRTVSALINGGPESGIWKSTDSGKSWKELTTGLPSADMGKIAIAVSPQKPDVVYATIELAGRTGGFWRSENGGASWTKQSDYISGGTGPHYYQELWADPHRFDVLYQANVQLGRTEDGGKTWKSVGNANKHVDNHAVVFHPTDKNFVLVGCDGGLYVSRDYAKHWQFFPNLPLTQFYKVDVDYDTPFYHVIGGTQDNNTQYGPTQTNNISGIRNSDWRITIGGDGHDCAIDPKDPNIIYCEAQQGFIRRYDRRTGESVDIRPQPEANEEGLRFNWDSPIYISPHSNKRLYFGSKKLHRSDDRGDSWKTISPDLSRNLDRFKLKIMDRIWSIDALWDLYAMSQYGNITSITESPLKEGLIYIGTDDGLIQVTEDGGNTWRKIDKIPGVPEYSFINDIKADLHDVNTVYAALDNHKTGDYRPYVVKSTDRGKTWTSIKGDLPDRHLVWRIEQDHVKKDLFFLGTEYGLFFSVNAGKNWIKLSGSPVIPFRDLAIQRRENDLVGATFGRSFYVLDDYTPLRKASEELFNEEFVFFPIKKAKLYIQDRPLGRPKGSQGDSFFTAPNPSFGATFTYYLRDTLKTRKQRRDEKESRIKKQGGDNPSPGWDELKKEEREASPVLFFTIKDEEGNVVSRITGDATEGIHRIAWDLRYSGFPGTGPLVVPGKYSVSVAKIADDKMSVLGKPTTFEVASITKPSLEPQERKETLAFQMKVAKLQRVLMAANGVVEEALEEIDAMKLALKDSRAVTALELHQQTRQLELQLKEMKERLTGDETRRQRSQETTRSMLARVQSAFAGTLRQTYGPTKTNRRDYAIALQLYKKESTKMRQLIEKELPSLKQKLDESAIRWTKGRQIPKLDDEKK